MMREVGGELKSKPEDLDVEFLNRDVEVVLQDMEVFQGRVVLTSKYWVKLLVHGKPIYVNKGFIAYVKFMT